MHRYGSKSIMSYECKMCYACTLVVCCLPFWSIGVALESPRSSHRKMTCACALNLGYRIFSSCFCCCCCDLAWMAAWYRQLCKEAARSYMRDIIYIYIKTEANCLGDPMLMHHEAHSPMHGCFPLFSITYII